MNKNNAFFKALESLGEENSVVTDLLIMLQNREGK